MPCTDLTHVQGRKQRATQQRVLCTPEYNETVTQELLSMGRCSGVVYKELFLTAEELHGARPLPL